MAALADPSITRLVLVARAQASSLAEIARTADELSETGIKPSNVVINGVLPDTAGADDSLVVAIRERERRPPSPTCRPRWRASRATSSNSSPTTWSASPPSGPCSSGATAVPMDAVGLPA